MFSMHPPRYDDFRSPATHLEGDLAKQIRAILEERFPSAASRHISGIINNIVMCFDIHAGIMARVENIDWVDYFDQQKGLMMGWQTAIVALSDVELIKDMARLPWLRCRSIAICIGSICRWETTRLCSEC